MSTTVQAPRYYVNILTTLQVARMTVVVAYITKQLSVFVTSLSRMQGTFMSPPTHPMANLLAGPAVLDIVCSHWNQFQR